MPRCPHCGKDGISIARKLFLGQGSPASCDLCGGKVVLPLHALLNVVPLLAGIAAAHLFLEELERTGAAIVIGASIVLVPIVNLVAFSVAPYRGRPGLRARLLSLGVTCVVAAAAAFFALEVARFAPTPAALTTTRTTDHFRIASNLPPDKLDHHVRFFEEFTALFERDYFPVPQARRLRMFLFADAATYEDYVRKYYRGYTPYGFYDARSNVIAVNCASGLGTATHELVHHFTTVAFSTLQPPWVFEGFAAFFEKFIGHFDANGKLQITFGYFSNWRFPQVKDAVEYLSLSSLAAARDADQSAAGSLMLFLHKKGLLRRFINEVRANPAANCLRHLDNVWGKTIPVIEEAWKDWVKAQRVDGDVNLVPESFVLPYREWQEWLRSRQSDIYFSENEQIYRARRP